MKKLLTGIGLTVLILVVVAVFIFMRARMAEISNPLISNGAQHLKVLDTSQAFDLNQLPDGWFHRKFMTVRAMDIAFTELDNKPTLQCKTANSASIFGRFTDVSLAEYPTIEWQWLVEKKIISDLDESEHQGDDHAARLFLTFLNKNSERYALEIVWANNSLKTGDDKIIGGFPHYVANGAEEEIGIWHSEQVNLLDLYQRYSGRQDVPQLTQVAIFCDSDQTGDSSVAYFSDIDLVRQVN